MNLNPIRTMKGIGPLTSYYEMVKTPDWETFGPSKENKKVVGLGGTFFRYIEEQILSGSMGVGKVGEVHFVVCTTSVKPCKVGVDSRIDLRRNSHWGRLWSSSSSWWVDSGCLTFYYLVQNSEF